MILVTIKISRIEFLLGRMDLSGAMDLCIVYVVSYVALPSRVVVWQRTGEWTDGGSEDGHCHPPGFDL